MSDGDTVYHTPATFEHYPDWHVRIESSMVFGDRLSIHRVDDGGRPRLMVELGPRATREDLRDLASFIIRFRDMLLPQIGPVDAGESIAYLEALVWRQQRGHATYAEIANQVNGQLESDILHGQIEHARFVLGCFGWGDTEIEARIAAALDRHASGQLPFDANGEPTIGEGPPLSGEMVRNKLRAWLHSPLHHRLNQNIE